MRALHKDRSAPGSWQKQRPSRDSRERYRSFESPIVGIGGIHAAQALSQSNEDDTKDPTVAAELVSGR
jgi:hypothetical protein